jgi:hypothetical protein
MIGVLMTFEALIISLILGTPSVICNHQTSAQSRDGHGTAFKGWHKLT